MLSSHNHLELKEFYLATIVIRVIAIIIALMLLTSSIPAFIFFTIAILPTFLAIYIDRKNFHKSLSATICAFNLLGVLPYLIHIIANKANMDYYSVQYLLSPKTWFVIYGASFSGRVLYYLIPYFISRWFMFKNNGEKKRLEERRNELMESWNIHLEHSDDKQ